jgi:plastocyanin
VRITYSLDSPRRIHPDCDPVVNNLSIRRTPIVLAHDLRGLANNGDSPIQEPLKREESRSIRSEELVLFAKVFCRRVNMRSSQASEEGVFLKRSVYVAALSVMVVLAFAAIALAQDSAQQSTSDPISTGTDTVPSPAPSQQEATPSEQTTSDESAPTVGIRNGAFDPAQLEVASGTPVTFVNEDTVAHTLSFEGLFDTPELPAGSSYPVTLEGTGTVTYNDEANPEVLLYQKDLPMMPRK